MSKRDRRGSIDDFIEKKVEDTVGRTLSEEVQFQDEIAPPEDPALKKILSSFPSVEGYYGKLYKVMPSGKEEMKYVFNALEEVNDPEVEVSELAKERKWGSGDFRLKVFKHGTAGTQKSLRMSIDATDSSHPSSAQPLVSPESLTDKLKELSDIVQTAREILPRNDSDTSKEYGETLAETFRSGVAVVKEALGPQISNSQDSVVKVISALKDLGIFTKPEPVKQTSETEIVERTIKNLKDMGVLVSPKSEDATLDKLIKLRETGLIKLAGEGKDDVLTLADKLKPIIEMVTSLGLGGNPPERSTFWNTLAPHIPSFIEKLSGPFKEYLELKKLEIQKTLERGGVYRSIASRGPANRLAQNATQATGERDIPSQQEEQQHPPQLNPIIGEILNAIQSRDYSYFPKLGELLTLFIGPHVVGALVNKQVSIDTFMSLILNSGYGQAFNIPEAKIYLQEFVFWLEQQEAVVRGNGIILAQCNGCKREFEFTKAEWESEEDKSCDEVGCSGTLERMDQIPITA